MTFMDSLAANSSNSPGSGVYGQPKIPDDQDTLFLVDRLKDREMRDFKDKTNFMSDLSLRQESRMRDLFAPEKKSPSDMPVTMMQDPNSMTGYQKGELGVRQQEVGQRQQGLNLESQRLSKQERLGQEALDVKTAQEKLNQQKSDQAHQQKLDELTTKQNEY